MGLKLLSLAVLLVAAVFGLLARRRPAAAPPFQAATLLCLGVACLSFLASLFITPRDEVEAQARRLSQLRSRIPLAALSRQMGGKGGIAVLVNTPEGSGISDEARQTVAEWTQLFPGHRFVLVGSRPAAWPATLRGVARDQLAAVLLEPLPGEPEELLLQDGEPLLRQPLLCLDPASTDKLLPLIRRGLVFAGLRTASNCLQGTPDLSDEELFQRNFLLVRAQDTALPDQTARHDDAAEEH